MMKLVFSFLVFLQMASASNASEISVLESCSQTLNQKPVYTVLNSFRNTLGGWSHIDKAQAEYQFLALETADYQIAQSDVIESEECGERKLQKGILVGKIADWTRQHSNGFEALLDKKDITYGDVSHVLIDLKINSSNTRIPSQSILNQRYGKLLTKSEKSLSELDLSMVNLGITLFAEGALDQSTSSFNAEYFLSIDQSILSDKWLRIVVPLSEFNFYTQKNYANSTAILASFLKEGIYGFRLNPETHKGKQLRNLIVKQWHDQIEESFKEISITLSRIELLKMKTNS